jgi:hypothetical protein
MAQPSHSSVTGGAMSDSIDPEVDAIQREWLVRNRLATRWIVVEEPQGYTVHHHTIDGVAPLSWYETKVQAVARLLQLMGVCEPVTPQTWPERVEIGLRRDEEQP